MLSFSEIAKYPSIMQVPDDFTHNFHVYMNVRDGEANFSPVWRAQLNLIFAIGAKFSHTIDADWAADTRDHLIYMKRAVNLLEMEDTLTIISGPNVPLVQAVSISNSLLPLLHTVKCGLIIVLFPTDWSFGLLFSGHRPCQSFMDHNWPICSACVGSRSPSSQ